MVRFSVVNVLELVVYDMVKGFFLRKKFMDDEFLLYFVFVFGAGFVIIVIVLFVDVVKIRYMNLLLNIYKSVIYCVYMLQKYNGFLVYYKGYVLDKNRVFFIRLVKCWRNIKLMVLYFFNYVNLDCNLIRFQVRVFANNKIVVMGDF